MPAGVPWRTYITFSIAAMFSMFLGAQTVHHFYRPLEDLPELIEMARKKEICKEVKKEES